MNEGILLYFSEEEFALMMELAGGKEYLVFLTEPEIDDRRLTEAFVSLFQRGLLMRERDTLVLSVEGAFFRNLRNATHVVWIRREIPKERTLLCYVQGGTLWVAELLAGNSNERYRLSMQRRRGIRRWLLETDILPHPQLREEDIRELKTIYVEELEQGPEGNAAVQISKFADNGSCLLEYSLYFGQVGLLLRTSCERNSEMRIYTQEALSEMLRQCFGG